MERIESAGVAGHVVRTLSFAGSHNAAASILRRARELIRWQLRVIARRRRMRATMAALDALDARTLKDIGLTRSEIHAVAAGTYGGRQARNDGTNDYREAA